MPLRFIDNAAFTSRVGIGTNNPTSPLHVVKDQGGVASVLKLENKAGANNSGFDIDFQLASSGLSAKIGAIRTNSPGAGDTDMFFSTSTNGTTTTEAMRISHDGNVGIGTTSPSEKLHIEASDPRIKIVDTDGTNWESEVFTQGGALKLQARNGTNFGNISFQGDNGTTQSEYARFNSSGNFGIGTTSPSQKLDVVGNVNLDGDNRHIYFGGSNTFIGENSNSNKLELRGGGSTQAQTVYIDNAGNVGIGTSSPSAKLEVAGSVGNFKTTGHQIFLTRNGNNEIYTVGASSVLALGTNSAEKMRIASDGNVGIGTTSPSEKLEVDGNIKSKRITLSHSGYAGYINQAGDFGGGPLYIRNQGQNHDINFQGNKGGTTSTSLHIDGLTHNVGIGTTSPSRKLSVYQSSSSMVADFRSASGNDSFISFSNNASTADQVRLGSSSGNLILSTNYVERLRIANTGNVGIGTTSPSHKLDIYSNENVPLRVHRPSNANLNSDGAWGIGFSTRGDAITSTSDTRAGIFSYYNGNLFLAAANTSIVADPIDYARLTVLNTGNVGIGTTTPGQKLHVQTTSGVTARFAYDSNNYQDLNWEGSNIVGGSHVFKIGGAEKMRITSGGNVGIGTNTPSEKLDVAGSIVVNTGQSLKWGAGATRIVGIDGSYIAMYPNNSEKVRFLSNGNVLIGTTTDSGYKLDVNGQIRASSGLEISGGNINLIDNSQLQLGTDADLVFYSDNTQTLMHNYNNNLIIKQDATDGDIIFQSDNGSGGTTEYYRIDGGSNLNVFSKNILLADSKQALFGNNSDLRIYHDGSNSYITDTGTGDLYIRGSNSVYIGNNAGTKTYISGTDGGATKLYYNGAGAQQKLETTSTGVNVTGTATATTFSGDLNGTINTATTAVTKANATNDTTVATTAFVQNLIGTIPAGLVFQGTWDAATNTPTLASGSGTTGHFYIVSTDGSTNLDGITDWKVGDWAVFVEQGATDAWEKVDNSSVLDGSGTGQKVALWSGSGTSNTLTDAPITVSGNNVGIGTSSPSSKLHIKQSVDSIDGGLTWESVDGTQEWSIDANNAGNFRIYKGTTAVARFDSSGNLGIGTSSPNSKLHVEGAVKAGDSSTGISLGIQSTDEYRINGIDTAGAGWNSLHLRADGTDGLFIQKDTNNVGIGTTNPAYKLDLKGESTAIRVWDNSDSVNSLFAVDNSGAFQGTFSNHPIRIFTNSSEKVRIAPSGNVGIGTTSPGSKLEVNGDITIADGNRLNIKSAGGTYTGYIEKDSYNANVNLGLTTTFTGARKIYINDGTNQRWEFGGTTTAASDNIIAPGGGYTESSIYAGHLGNIGFFTRASTIAANVMKLFDRTDNNNHGVKLIYKSGGTYGDGLVLDNNGNVGIGTTSPSEKLHVFGGAAAIEIDSTTNEASLKYDNSTTTATIKLANNDLKTELGGSEKMRITSSGNVGIGTASPNDATVIKTNTDGKGLTLQRNSTTPGTYSQLGFYQSTNDAGSANVWIRGYRETAFADNYMTFGTNSSEKMRITSGGNVGIGTTSPSKKLEVNGQTKFYEYSGAHLTHQATSNFNFDTLANNSASTNGGSVGAYIKLTGTPPGATGVWSTFRARAYGENAQGNTDGMITFFSEYRNYTSTNAVTLNYHAGLYVNPLGVGGSATVTNNYGVYLNPGTAATNNYGVYQNGSSVKNFFQGNVGIGTTSPSTRLQVDGGVQMADDTDAASADKVGTMRYRTSGNNSYVDMCMQTGATTYAWINIVQNNW